MICKHFPLFSHGIASAQSECPTSRQGVLLLVVCQWLLAWLLALRKRGVHETHTRVLYFLQSSTVRKECNFLFGYTVVSAKLRCEKKLERRVSHPNHIAMIDRYEHRRQ